ncbi:diguanylate cyclase [Pseudomarimonas salicorniae]|uniref:Diguanylate cyclase n=1 Tax=Pseudomarimonas salicorniae TaxID=2933270 RepID=A0ABT0GCP4_9GAMM|nr:diguanylate cyclase [Lysobacter sp. CAU 1642]
MDQFTDISLKVFLEHAHIGVVIHRWDGTIVYANPASLQLLRMSYGQLIGHDDRDPQWNFIDENNRRLQPDEYPVNKVKRFRSPLRNEVVGVVDSSRPEVTWFSVNAYPEGHTGDDWSGEGFIVVLFSEVTSDRQNFSFRDIVEHAADVVIVTEADDIDGPTGPRIVYVNRAFEELTGYSPEEVLGETPRLLQGKLTSAEACARIREALGRKEAVRETLLNYGKTGRPYWLDMNIVPLSNRLGQVTHFAAIERNVSDSVFHADQLEQRNRDLRELKQNLQALVDRRTTELREANHRLEKLAFYDELTGIPNRRSFLDQSAQQFSRARRRGERLAFGMLDLDHFKTINDEHGHEAGDRALIAVAGCLERFFRQEDCFGRIGGEEFAFTMLLGRRGEADASAIASRLRQAIATTRVVPQGAGPLKLKASIGLCVFDPAEHDLEDAMRRADEAMYRAKQAGRDRLEVIVLGPDPD